MFELYFEEVLKDTTKLHYCFIGINKKDFPKWEGWKIISKYKEDGVSIEDINDKRLNILVENFYRLKYLEQLIYND